MFEHLRGTITSFGLAGGDRVVVGAWHRSPLGPFADVMWTDVDGRRTLLAPSEEALRYVSGIYRFDHTEVVPFAWQADPARLSLHAGPLEAEIRAAGGVRLPVPRPWAFTRWVEGPLARAAMGVRTWGHSPSGVEEWYQARGWRWITEGRVSVDGRRRDPVAAMWPPVGVGFSEPPRRPSVVDVAVRIRRPGPVLSP